MDCKKTGELIYKLRKEKNLTQNQLADMLNMSDRTISKWERGIGCPDVSVLCELSEILKVDISKMLTGELSQNDFVNGNMKNTKFYVCPHCGNVIISTGNAAICCCGRTLQTLKKQKADSMHELDVQNIEDELYITTKHTMQKQHYISFIAFALGDKVQIIKQYPEWNMETRIPYRGHGLLLWYCTKHGLFYKNI